MDSAVSHSMRITRKLSRALDSLRPPVPVLYREDALPTTSAALPLLLVLKDTVPMDAPVTLRWASFAAAGMFSSCGLDAAQNSRPAKSELAYIVQSSAHWKSKRKSLSETVLPVPAVERHIRFAVTEQASWQTCSYIWPGRQYPCCTKTATVFLESAVRCHNRPRSKTGYSQRWPTPAIPHAAAPA